MKIFIVEHKLGNPYTTFKNQDGEMQRVPIGARRIGPFTLMTEVTAWLSRRALRSAIYEIQRCIEPEEI